MDSETPERLAVIDGDAEDNDDDNDDDHTEMTRHIQTEDWYFHLGADWLLRGKRPLASVSAGVLSGGACP